MPSVHRWTPPKKASRTPSPRGGRSSDHRQHACRDPRARAGRALVDVRARAAPVRARRGRAAGCWFVRGEGARLWDDRGREHLDFLGGIATVAAGHADPHVLGAITGQLGRLGPTTNLYLTGPQGELA